MVGPRAPAAKSLACQSTVRLDAPYKPIQVMFNVNRKKRGEIEEKERKKEEENRKWK